VADFGEPEPAVEPLAAALERAHARADLVARLDCAAYTLETPRLETLIAIAKIAEGLDADGLERVLSYARALSAW
jgi:hypothetical protein